MKRFGLWVSWLKIVSIIFALFGIVLALCNQMPVFYTLFNNQINPAFWGSLSPIMETVHFQQWVYGLLGATCVMVGVLIYFIVENAFRNKQMWAWNCLCSALVLWFILDEPISLYFQVYFNAVFNLVLLLAVLVPLLCTRKYFVGVRQTRHE